MFSVCVCVSYSGLPFPSHWRWKLSPSLGKSLLGEICTFGESVSYKERERERNMERKTERYWLHNKRLSTNTSTAAIISFSLISIYLLPSASCRRHRVAASHSDITPSYTTGARLWGGGEAASPTTGWQHWHRLMHLPSLSSCCSSFPLTDSNSRRARRGIKSKFLRRCHYER